MTAGTIEQRMGVSSTGQWGPPPPPEAMPLSLGEWGTIGVMRPPRPPKQTHGRPPGH